MNKQHIWLIITNIVILVVMVLWAVHYTTAQIKSIDKETLAVASLKCAYNGSKLQNIEQFRYSGLENLKQIETHSLFSQKYTITCDNGAMFQFTANWKQPLTYPVETDTIVAPKK